MHEPREHLGLGDRLSEGPAPKLITSTSALALSESG
jgi:hypothetical protein